MAEPAAEMWSALKECGAYREGHFLLTSGRHGDRFFLFSQAFQHPALAARFGRAVAWLFAPNAVGAAGGASGVETVAGPAIGGVILAHEAAKALGVRSIFAEKTEDGRMELKRGFMLRPGERVLVVEDAVTTGGSVRKTIDAVRSAGGTVVGVGAVVDRSGGRADFGVPFRAVLTAEAHDWAPADCPLCAAGVELVRPKA